MTTAQKSVVRTLLQQELEARTHPVVDLLTGRPARETAREALLTRLLLRRQRQLDKSEVHERLANRGARLAPR